MSAGESQGGAQAKISSSGHGQAYVALRDFADQRIEIRDSHVTIIEARAHEAKDRQQQAHELLDGIDALKARLAQMTAAAQATENHLKEEVKRARAEGRAQALLESQARLREAERKRREVEARLVRVEDERDQAVKLMREAQLQAINALNELEEARRTAQLEANLQAVREHMEQAAQSGALSREEPYQDLIAATDAELDSYSTRLATLSTELDESAMRSQAADAAVPVLPPTPAPTPPSPGARPQGETQPPIPPSLAAETQRSRPHSARAAAVSAASQLSMPPGTAILAGLVPAIGFAALFGAAGISIKDMITAQVGPAIGWQVLYSVISFGSMAIIGVLVGVCFFL